MIRGQGAEAHVGDEERDLEGERLRRPRADHELGAHLDLVELRQGGELGGDELPVAAGSRKTEQARRLRSSWCAGPVPNPIG